MLKHRGILKVRNKNILIRKTAKNHQIVVPSSHQLIILKKRRENMTHHGADTVYHLAKERFYWPNMEKDIIDFVTQRQCQFVPKVMSRRIPHPKSWIVTSSASINVITIDFLKVNRWAVAYEHLLVIVGLFTLYATNYATRSKPEKREARQLLK